MCCSASLSQSVIRGGKWFIWLCELLSHAAGTILSPFYVFMTVSSRPLLAVVIDSFWKGYVIDCSVFLPPTPHSFSSPLHRKNCPHFFFFLWNNLSTYAVLLKSQHNTVPSFSRQHSWFLPRSWAGESWCGERSCWWIVNSIFLVSTKPTSNIAFVWAQTAF